MVLLTIVPMVTGDPVGWFAPTYKLLKPAWRQVRRSLAPITHEANATEYRIELTNGGVIDMWTLEDKDAGRGRKYARVIVDEAGLAAGLEEQWTKNIRATLTDLKGDAWFLSTPKGRNYFWQLYQSGQDPLQENFASWEMPTRTNPWISEQEIEAARQMLPEDVFRQEYLAEFLEDGAIFKGVTAAARAKEQKHKRHGHEYVIGVDWGKYEDYSVFTVIDASLGEMVYMERMNQIDYRQQLPRLRTLIDEFDPYEIVAESNMSEKLIEDMQYEGWPVTRFQTGQNNKQEIIEALQNGIEKRELTILDDKVLIGELQAFEAVRLPSGRLKYSAPEGYHDDCVMSLALAWSSARYGVTDIGGIKPKAQEMYNYG